MLNGLDLFSGIGGLSMALEQWVRPIAYCEIDLYCHGVLLGQMASKRLATAPIWDDIRTFPAAEFSEKGIDIISGGFPCQDISVAGRGKGLEGQRSGLFFEIVRLAKEIKPKFIFLENVPAITSRGGIEVVRQVAEMGYDCRWCVISAASIGALHRRERWFLLAYAKHAGSHGSQKQGSNEKTVHDNPQRQNATEQPTGSDQSRVLATESVSDPEGSGLSSAWYESRNKTKESLSPCLSEYDVPNPSSIRCDQGASKGIYTQREPSQHEESPNDSGQVLNYWQNIEPPVCGIPHGIPHRVDRIRALGNAVVPSQAKEAFKILMGLT